MIPRDPDTQLQLRYSQCLPTFTNQMEAPRYREGHVSASMSTILTPFTKLLSIEHRWIVTGTPTTNLLGLNFGAKVDSMQELYGDEGDTEFWELFKDPEGSASQSREVTPPPVKQARIWNKYDRGGPPETGEYDHTFCWCSPIPG